MVSAIVRFVGTLVAGLAACYLAAHGMSLLGLCDEATLVGVDAFYAAVLRPVASLDPAIHRTLYVLAAAAALHLLVLHRLFGRWAYRPNDRTDPLTAVARSTDWNARPEHTAAAAANTGLNRVAEPSPAAVAAGGPRDEYDRLLSVLRRAE